MNDDIERFIKAQENVYDNALNEIKNGRKISHWMWFIFPQINGLGKSSISNYFSIKSLDEANSYLNHEILGTRIREISNILLGLETTDPIEVFGYVDSLKLRSSMTLFAYISNEEVFTKVLDKFYQGQKDEKTIAICDELRSIKLSKK